MQPDVRLPMTPAMVDGLAENAMLHAFNYLRERLLSSGEARQSLDDFLLPDRQAAVKKIFTDFIEWELRGVESLRKSDANRIPFSVFVDLSRTALFETVRAASAEEAASLVRRQFPDAELTALPVLSPGMRVRVPRRLSDAGIGRGVYEVLEVPTQTGYLMDVNSPVVLMSSKRVVVRVLAHELDLDVGSLLELNAKQSLPTKAA